MISPRVAARRRVRRMTNEQLALELRLLGVAPTAKARAGLRALGEQEREAVLTEAAARLVGALQVMAA